VAVFIILLLIALVSLGFAVLVLAVSPRSFGVRAAVAMPVVVIGCAPLVSLFVGLSGWPTRD